MRNLIFVSMISLLVAGCGSSPPTTVPQKSKEEHGHVKQGKTTGAHEGHNPTGNTATLVVQTKPLVIKLGNSTEINMMLHAPSGEMLSKFDLLHEKLAHLIIVREGLDEFVHLHPEIDEQGNFKANYTFPVAGKYRLYLDHQLAGKTPATAKSEIMIEGNSPAAAPLVPNVPGLIKGDGLAAEVKIDDSKKNETRLSFTIFASDDQLVLDLQPYLGAMGHLVVISQDGLDYVHAHPIEDSAKPGTVEFGAHFNTPGIYKAWGQFQRQGKVFTIPGVIKISPIASPKSK